MVKKALLLDRNKEQINRLICSQDYENVCFLRYKDICVLNALGESSGFSYQKETLLYLDQLMHRKAF